MSNIGLIGIPEKCEKEIGKEKLFKDMMTENFPNLVK